MAYCSIEEKGFVHLVLFSAISSSDSMMFLPQRERRGNVMVRRGGPPKGGINVHCCCSTLGTESQRERERERERERRGEGHALPHSFASLIHCAVLLSPCLSAVAVPAQAVGVAAVTVDVVVAAFPHHLPLLAPTHLAANS